MVFSYIFLNYGCEEKRGKCVMEDSFVLKLKNRKFSEFYLCFCGRTRCEPLHSYGPAVRPNYLIHIILEGQGRYVVDGEEYDLRAGQGFMIEPDQQTFYQADERNPWSYLWIGFDGTRAREYLADLGLGEGTRTFYCREVSELQAMLLEVMERDTYTIENEFLRESFLYGFFAVLSRSLMVGEISRSDTENIYVRKAIEYIQNNYTEPIHVTDIARYVGISRGYLHTLFVRTLSQSPQEYLINCRITRSAELLSETDLSIESIAMSCGYLDPLVFSKLFKKKMGTTPTFYRKKSGESYRENKNSVHFD